MMQNSIPPTDDPNTPSPDQQVDVWQGDPSSKANVLSRSMNKLGISKNNFTKSYPSVTVICIGLPVDETCSILELG